MKKILLIMTMLIACLSSMAAAAPADGNSQKIAVVPYIDNSEQNKDYIKTTVDEYYTNYWATQGYVLVDPVTVQQALDNAGFDASNKIAPEKDIMADVAKATGADFVIAMEIENINASRHVSMFSTKVRVSTKIRYNFYSATKNRMTPFQTTGECNNKAVMVGDVGYKAPIVKALHQAMDAGNLKIKSYINAANSVNVNVANARQG